MEGLEKRHTRDINKQKEKETQINNRNMESKKNNK